MGVPDAHLRAPGGRDPLRLADRDGRPGGEEGDGGQPRQTRPGGAGGGRVPEVLRGAGDDPALKEAESWYAAVINDTEPLVKPEQALVVTQILEGIYKSAKTGEPVYL